MEQKKLPQGQGICTKTVLCNECNVPFVITYNYQLAQDYRPRCIDIKFVTISLTVSRLKLGV